jgi:RNA polymerase sigma-70 factor (ECF subfamily)
MHPEAGADLIERARHDRIAFGAIYDLYVRRVYAFCLSHTGNKEVAEDVTSQTFERALGAIARYQHRGAPLSSWLFRIAANLITDRSRQSGRVVLLGDDPPPESRLDHPSEPQPDEVVERWERAASIRSLMADLPADQQEALRLRYWDGMAVAEVAVRLGRNENATKQLLFRATTGLRRRIDRQGSHDV